LLVRTRTAPRHGAPDPLPVIAEGVRRCPAVTGFLRVAAVNTRGSSSGGSPALTRPHRTRHRAPLRRPWGLPSRSASVTKKPGDQGPHGARNSAGDSDPDNIESPRAYLPVGHIVTPPTWSPGWAPQQQSARRVPAQGAPTSRGSKVAACPELAPAQRIPPSSRH
jgi:hypothetical protein